MARLPSAAIDPETLQILRATPDFDRVQLANGGQEVGITNDYHQTDLGNSERLVQRHGTDLRYCHLWRKWFVWDGRRWCEDATGEVQRRAKSTVRSMYGEAEKTEEDNKRWALLEHAKKSERKERIAAMVALAKSEPGIPVLPDQLDADPWLLNCLNGTIDLRTGELREHRRLDLITKLAPVEYDASASCPIFETFLDQIMNGNQDLVRFIQRVFGYSLTGDMREQVLIILHGMGGNGKSTLVELLHDLLGDYAMRTPTETLMVTQQERIPNDVARLKGTRFVHASETEDGKRLAESRIKDLTGGDTISARFMRAEWFDFRPMFKLWLSSNHKPVIRGTDNAIWRRVRLIPFAVTFLADKQDRGLPGKLRAELAGILRWGVEGCLAWQRDGLREPVGVTSATQGYRGEMDVLAAFLEECCVRTTNASARATKLYEAYRTWCERNGEYPSTQRAFGMSLSERGFEKTRSGPNGSYVWHGVGLLNELNDTEPTSGINRQDSSREVSQKKLQDGSVGSVDARQRFVV